MLSACHREIRLGPLSQVCPGQRRALRRQTGHTLLELMIAFALGLMLILAAVTLYRGQRELFEQIVQRARRMDAGLTALHLMSVHLRLAGFAGPGDAPPGVAILGCSLGRPRNLLDSSPKTTVCEPNAASGSDGIEVRYRADEVNTWASAEGCATDCLGQAIVTDDASQAGAAALAVNRFFVRASPSTRAVELYGEGSGRFNIAQPMVEGIERLRIRYWLAGASRLVEASAVPPAAWPQVAAVELCVLVRGTQRSLATSYIDCDGRRVTASDGLPRDAFTTWVALRNRGLAW
ncbi:MAG: type IV pilus assembly protein PilW [Glomeribacter sp. 1016415]|nr:type IV pilus assembly protein PilW [Glomeribacter sp. 1016415]